MQAHRVRRHIEALTLAATCVDLGARTSVVTMLTGLPHKDIQRLFFSSESSSAPRGRPPESIEWYHTANLLNRIEASIFVGLYKRVRTTGFRPTTALLTAYRQYLGVCDADPRIGFDRAFHLAAHTEGIWVASEQDLALKTCKLCGCKYIVGYGITTAHDNDCPFCKLMQRYRVDPRVQNSFKPHPVPEDAECMAT